MIKKLNETIINELYGIMKLNKKCSKFIFQQYPDNKIEII